ncbi:hypothetical protein ZOSMA_216G00170 [Zostera marina]|uniref:Plant disease resistance WDH domain-containing protein n=1 Tax=Zostera marina TaxID=29655 RepID=A0A0K9PM96_ZOSMR|nr:hypothetical protein ZOSMA_216G00170 [Zostera marina]
MSKEPCFGYRYDLNGGSLSSSPTESYDVYIGFLGRRKHLLRRFVKWLQAELQIQGITSFISYTNRRSNEEDRNVSMAAMISAYVILIIITEDTFSDPCWIDELGGFVNERNFLPIFFNFGKFPDLVEYIKEAKEGKKVWNGLGGFHSENWQSVADWIQMLKLKLEAYAGNWRDCISEAVIFAGKKLGRKKVVKKVKQWKKWSRNEEFLFPRNKSFVGRKKELDELELRLFGYIEEREDLELATTSSGKGCDGGLSRKGKEPIEYNISHNIKGFACVTGDPGIGKTELLLEFAYKLRSRYKNVLWIGGETRYIWHNYLNLLPILGIDVGIKEERHNTTDDYLRTFDNLEIEVIRRVKKELTRGIPYLLVIDNLENSKDWWKDRSIMEFLPELGKDTHVIISTRLEEVVMNSSPMRLLPFSLSEAMSLMVPGSAENFPEDDDICALRLIFERLNGITLGISIVQAILLELHMSPEKLLRSINRMPYNITLNKELSTGGGYNKVLIQLVHFCLLVFNLVDKSRNLALRMVKASGWFAPSPVPIPLLVSAAFKIPIQNSHHHKSWKWRLRQITSFGNCTNEDIMVQKASSMLVRFHMAKRCTKDGFLHFNDIIRLYLQKEHFKSGVFAMVEAVNLNASLSLPYNYDHIWEACYNVLTFDAEPTIIELTPSEFISFAKRHVIPLAMKILSTSCYHTCAMELLRRSTEKLELVESLLFADQAHRSVCWWLNTEFDPLIYRELVLLKADHLELRAKIMCIGGSFDIGEELYMKALRIKEVFLGSNHSETTPTQEIMGKLLIKEPETTSSETSNTGSFSQ